MERKALIMVGAVCLMAGCAQSKAGEAQDRSEVAVKDEDKAISPLAKTSRPPTIKPGAGVGFTHTQVGTGRVGEVRFTVTEGYEAGTLVLEANGDNGLYVFGAAVTQRVDMADGDAHEWRVNFEAEADGIYFINASATAEVEGAPKMWRAYSARIEVGSAPASKAQSLVETGPSGEAIMVMDAEEEIIE